MREIIEKIIDGCSEVKKNPKIHKDAKDLATLVIKDCNDALKKEWVSLTDEEILADDVLRYHFGLNGGAGPVSKKGKAIIAAVEAKLQEKNHG
jgi:hypothetical protein